MTGVVWFGAYFFLPPMNYVDAGMMTSFNTKLKSIGTSNHRVVPYESVEVETATSDPPELPNQESAGATVAPTIGKIAADHKQSSFIYWSLLFEKDAVELDSNNHFILRKKDP